MNVSNSKKKKLSTFVGGFLRLYTRCLCILIRDSCFLAWGSCGVLVGKEVCFRLTYYHPHTQHTHTHSILVRRFPLPGGGNIVQTCVCALAEGVHKTIRRVLFNIASHFRYQVLRHVYITYFPYLV